MIRVLVFTAVVFSQSLIWAAALDVGSTREEVIAVLGEPVGRSSAGSREVLSYAQGRVFLREGRVEEIDAALIPAEPAPVAPAPVAETKPQPAAPQQPAPPPPPIEVPVEQGGNWIKLAGLTVFFGVVLLLGRHFIREARRAQEAKKRDLLSR